MGGIRKINGYHPNIQLDNYPAGPYLYFVQRSKCDQRNKYESRCTVKMTDQAEWDYFQAELASGRANRNHMSDADDVKAVSAVMAALLVVAMLVMWLGR